MKTVRVVGLLIWTVGALAVTQTRGQTIDFSITAGPGNTVITVMTPASGCTSTSCGLSGSDLNALNAQLAGAGSGYSFSALSGNSDFSGSPSQGLLSLSGFIQFHGGNNSLTLTETESGFTLPNGLPGILTSSSGADFGNTIPGDSQTFHSSLNLILTPAVVLTSTGGPSNSQSGMSPPIGIPAFVPSYVLDNSVSFSLSNASSTDGFDVAGTYQPLSATPEPVSMLLYGTGIVVLGAKFRRRKRGNPVAA